MKIIIGLIKEYFESRRNKRKIKAIYKGNPPTHKGYEDIKNGTYIDPNS